MNGVTAIANVLKMEGVDFIACIPSNPLIEPAAIAGIRPIVFRQECTGVHMADGFSRIHNGKRLGIFLMQSGPGAENAFGGVAQAYADSVPILLLPAAASRDRLGIPPHLQPVPQLRDHHEVVGADPGRQPGDRGNAEGLHQAKERTPWPRFAGDTLGRGGGRAG